MNLRAISFAAVIMTFCMTGLADTIDFIGFGEVDVSELCTASNSGTTSLRIKDIEEQLVEQEKLSSRSCLAMGHDYFLPSLAEACNKVSDLGLPLDISVGEINTDYLNEEELVSIVGVEECPTRDLLN